MFVFSIRSEPSRAERRDDDDDHEGDEVLEGAVGGRIHEREGEEGEWGGGRQGWRIEHEHDYEQEHEGECGS